MTSSGRIHLLFAESVLFIRAYRYGYELDPAPVPAYSESLFGNLDTTWNGQILDTGGTP